MNEIAIVDSERYEQMEKVAKLRMYGTNPTAVAKQLGLQRKVVIELYDDYKEILRRDGESQDRALDLLNLMIEQYDGLIEDTHKLLEKIRDQQFDDKYANQEAKALGLIGEFIAKRLDAVQKAGLLDNDALGDELADMEEKAALLIDILRNDLCDVCRRHVAEKLQKVTQKVEAVVVYDD